MPFDLINLGTTPGDGTGDDLRTAGTKINALVNYLNANSPSLYDIHNSNVSVVKNQLMFVDTSANAVDITLPTTPTFGDSFTLTDYAGTWNTNNCTIKYNTVDRLQRLTVDLVLSTQDATVRMTYVDATVGWVQT